MTESKELFNNLEEKDLQLHIYIRDDGRYSSKGTGAITFKRDSSSHIHLKDVMYVPSLKKNLDFVVVLEEHGYDVVFSKGGTYLKHVSTRQVK